MPPRPPARIEETSSVDDEDEVEDEVEEEGGGLPSGAEVGQSERYSTPRGSSKTSGGGAAAQSPVLTDARSNSKGYYLSAGVALSQRGEGFDGTGYYSASPPPGVGGSGPYSFANHPTRDMMRSPYKSPYRQTPPAPPRSSPGGVLRGSLYPSKGVSLYPSRGVSGTPPIHSRPPLPKGSSGTIMDRAVAALGAAGTPSPKRRLGGTFSPRRPFHLPGPKGSPVCTFGSGH